MVRKLLRTLQVQFPFLQDAKFKVMRTTCNLLKRPIEYDFNALALFPQVDGALFLDVGANRGLSTDAILMKRKNVRVHLFEPNELLFEKLGTLFGDNPGIAIDNFGLGCENTEGTLYVPFYRGWMFDGLASFDESAALEWLRGNVYFYDDRYLTVGRFICRIRKLDDLKLEPFLIKLDVQGYEYKALKGGEETIRTHEPVLLIESPDADAMKFLKELRYDCYAYRRGTFVPGERGELNTYFMTQGKARLVQEHVRAQNCLRQET